jgi:Sigma-70 region 2
MATVTPGLAARQASDAVIIQQSWLEPERFAAIFDRYYAQIHDYAARRLGQSLVDDVAAEAFLIAFARRQRYDISRPDARPDASLTGDFTWLEPTRANLASLRVTIPHGYRQLPADVDTGAALSWNPGPVRANMP